MLEFFNANAGAMQVLLSTCVVLSTIVLVAVTWRYVALTSQLAITARAQLEFQRDLRRELRDSKRRELIAVVKNLRLLLAHLPYEPERGERMRDAALWQDDNPMYLQRLASEYDEVLAGHAATAVAALRWLKERVIEVKNVPRVQGVKWQEFPWSRWSEELRVARDELEVLWTAVNSSPADGSEGVV